MKDTLRLTNDTSETPLLGEWVEKIGERMDLPTDKVFGLNLALEEAVVNVMNYAYPEQKGMPIYLVRCASCSKMKVCLLIQPAMSCPTLL